jgi:aryl-alcohol dehydrogenase-like predicted oxidoreductase
VSVDEIEAARRLAEIATVQNLYNLTNRQSEDVLDYCTREGLGFIPWYPIAAGRLAEPGGAVAEIAKNYDASPAQVALAWLLARAQVMLPIPGTSSVEHLEENMGAAALYQRLSRDDVASLTSASG